MAPPDGYRRYYTRKGPAASAAQKQMDDGKRSLQRMQDGILGSGVGWFTAKQKVSAPVRPWVMVVTSGDQEIRLHLKVLLLVVCAEGFSWNLLPFGLCSS